MRTILRCLLTIIMQVSLFIIAVSFVKHILDPKMSLFLSSIIYFGLGCMLTYPMDYIYNSVKKIFKQN
jgi:hypothetical protein